MRRPDENDLCRNFRPENVRGFCDTPRDPQSRPHGPGEDPLRPDLCHLPWPRWQGDGPGGGGLNPKPRNFKSQAGWKNGTRLEDIYKTLEEGIKGSSMVSYSYLSRKDRMALTHEVMALGAFQHAPSDPKNLAALEKLFASAGEVIPNRIPVAHAVDILCREYAEAHPGGSPKPAAAPAP